MSNYVPKQMTHPAYQPAVVGYAHGEGRPALNPPATVYTPEQEEEYRARGYVPVGEAPRAPVGFLEYPMMMEHPRHVPEVIIEATAVMVDGKPVVTPRRIVPAEWPPVVARDATERRGWETKGYAARESAPAEFLSSKASPLASDAYRPSDYPMWVGDKVVASREEHVALMEKTGEMPRVNPVPAADPRDRALAEALAEIEALKAARATKGPRKAKPAKRRASKPRVAARGVAASAEDGDKVTTAA